LQTRPGLAEASTNKRNESNKKKERKKERERANARRKNVQCKKEE